MLNRAPSSLHGYSKSYDPYLGSLLLRAGLSSPANIRDKYGNQEVGVRVHNIQKYAHKHVLHIYVDKIDFRRSRSPCHGWMDLEPGECRVLGIE